MTALEERIVVVRARGFDEAIRKAEAIAEKYSESVNYKNVSDEIVRSRYLGMCDAFRTNCENSAPTEVYSKLRIVSGAQELKQVAELLIGPAENEEREKLGRLRFEPK